MSYCCHEMEEAATSTCEQHPKREECPDALITGITAGGPGSGGTFTPVHILYGIIIHDGGNAFATISYCPWCGSKL